MAVLDIGPISPHQNEQGAVFVNFVQQLLFPPGAAGDVLLVTKDLLISEAATELTPQRTGRVLRVRASVADEDPLHG